MNNPEQAAPSELHKAASALLTALDSIYALAAQAPPDMPQAECPIESARVDRDGQRIHWRDPSGQKWSVRYEGGDGYVDFKTIGEWEKVGGPFQAPQAEPKFAPREYPGWETGKPRAQNAEPVAYVPIHPRDGPLWANTVTTLDADRPTHYPTKPVYFAPFGPIAPPAVPEGWVMVPREPTRKMLLAKSTKEHELRESRMGPWEKWVAAYQAMIAAAPPGEPRSGER